MKCNNYECRKKILQKKATICFALLFLIAIIDTVLIVFRNEKNHYLFLIICLLSNIIVSWIIIYLIINEIIPISRLQNMEKISNINIEGTIKSISNNTIRYMNYDCYEIALDNNDCYYIIDKNGLKENEKVIIKHYNNLILEVYYEKNNI